MSEIKNILDYQKLASWMGKALRSPRPNEDAIPPEKLLDANAALYLTANTRLTALQRLDIYSIDYWSRFLESLDEDFPTLQYLLGKDKLHLIWEAYLQQYPSRSYLLRDLGQSLPLFFQQTEDPQKSLYTEIAQFELALIEAFDEAELPLYEVENLNEEQRNQLTELPLILQPYVRLLDITYAVDTLRENALHKDEMPTLVMLSEEASLLVFRHSLKVHTQRISRLQARFFRLFQQATSLTEACALLLPQLAPEEIECFASEIQSWMQTACSKQWLALA